MSITRNTAYYSSKQPCSTRRGFTLIELLVVIAIISLLVSILLPSLTRAKELTKSLVCMNILRSFGLANAMYAEESDGYMVPVRYHPAGITWIRNSLFRSYLGITGDSLKMDYFPIGLICPEATVSLSFVYSLDSQWCLAQLSWGMNVTDQNLTQQDIGYDIAQIPYPERKLLFADAMDWWIIEWWSNAYTVENPADYMAAAYRHRNQIHIGYFDGHVESLPRENVAFNDELWKPMAP